MPRPTFVPLLNHLVCLGMLESSWMNVETGTHARARCMSTLNTTTCFGKVSVHAYKQATYQARTIGGVQETRVLHCNSCASIFLYHSQLAQSNLVKFLYFSQRWSRWKINAVKRKTTTINWALCLTEEPSRDSDWHVCFAPTFFLTKRTGLRVWSLCVCTKLLPLSLEGS